MNKWGSRALLVAGMLNFVAAVWFAQYITTGWVLYLYVVGSFVVMGITMVLAE